MKTVTGKVVSTKPISLSNAAKYITRFASSDNEASYAVAAYLQRASDSFNCLVNFQKKLKGSHSHREGRVGIDAEVEALSPADEKPQVEKVRKLERKGKKKNNEEFELKNDVPLESKKDKVEVDEVKVRESSKNKQKDEEIQVFEVNNEETVKIEKRPLSVVEKEKNKKPGKGKNEETAQRGVDGEDADGKVVEHKGKKEGRKGEGLDPIHCDILIEDDEVEGFSTQKMDKKKRKKKRKENEEKDTEIVKEDKGQTQKSREVDNEGGQKKTQKDWKADGGETNDQSQYSGKKEGRKTEGLDPIHCDILIEDGAKMNGVEGVSMQKMDKKKRKKKRKENGVDGSVVDKSGEKKGSKADSYDKVKQLNMEEDCVEAKGKMDRIDEGSLEKKKKKKKKSEVEEVEKSLENEEGRKRKSREVDGEEAIDSAEQHGKKKKKRRT